MSQNDDLKSLLDSIKKHTKPVFFISPHLDDAVLSCGDLIAELGKYTDVTVLTIFTDAHSSPATFSARRFLMHCGEKNAKELFQKRREEDKKAIKVLGASYLHLNKVDGTWRMFARPGFLRSMIGRLFPEFVHLYPTFLHVRMGKLVKEDRKNISSLFEEIKNIIPTDSVIFAPLAVGNHIDHVFTRELASRFDHVIYWSDFPYLLTNKLPSEFISKKGLQKVAFSGKNQMKEEAIKKYITQLPSLFPSGEIPAVEETYYVTQGIDVL